MELRYQLFLANEKRRVSAFIGIVGYCSGVVPDTYFTYYKLYNFFEREEVEKVI